MKSTNIAFVLSLVLGLCTAADAKVYEGRVEVLEAAPVPVFDAGAEADASARFPAEIRGKWAGSVQITRLTAYPSMHREPADIRFIQEAIGAFQQGDIARVGVRFAEEKGKMAAGLSDAVFPNRYKIKLTQKAGPALLPDCVNHIQSVRDTVQQTANDVFEQNRVDKVDVVRSDGAVVQSGYNETDITYRIVSPKLLEMKIVNVDYAASRKPLWLVVMHGYLRKQ